MYIIYIYIYIYIRKTEGKKEGREGRPTVLIFFDLLPCIKY